MATLTTVTTNLQERTLWVSHLNQIGELLVSMSSSEMSQVVWAEPELLRPLPWVLCNADTMLSRGTSLVPQGGGSRWPTSPLTSHSLVNSYMPLEGLCFLLRLIVLTFSWEWRAGAWALGSQFWSMTASRVSGVVNGPSIPFQLSNLGSRLRPGQGYQCEDGGWSPWRRAALKLTGAKS